MEGVFDSPSGPTYKASAIAILEGKAFELDPPETGYQSLDQDRITWDWFIRPIEPGTQTIIARIVVQWEPTEGEGDTIERTIWRAPLEIEVEKPWIKTAQLYVLSPASGLLGLVLSAPLVYQKVRERGEKRRRRLSPLDQLTEARENLRLIRERKSQYVLETDIPLQLIKEERRLLGHIEELEKRIEEERRNTRAG